MLAPGLCEKTRPVRTIGLTGGIGSGKSTVARILGELGAEVIDADRIGHEIYRPGTPGWRKVAGAFGHEILAADGTIDRKKLGSRVFASPAELARLNSLLHPLMAEEIRGRIEALRAGGRRSPVVVEAAVLLEAGWDALVDEVWVVEASRETAIARVIADRQLARDEVERRVDNQMSSEERAQAADCIIRNAGTLEELRAEVTRIWGVRAKG